MSFATNSPQALAHDLQLPSSLQLSGGNAEVHLYAAAGLTTKLDVGVNVNALTINNATGVVTFGAAPVIPPPIPVATGPSVTVGPANANYAVAFNFAAAALPAGLYLCVDAGSIGATPRPELSPAFTVYWDGTKAYNNLFGLFSNDAGLLVPKYSDGTVNDVAFGINTGGTIPLSPNVSVIVSQDTAVGNASTHQLTIFRLR